MKIKYSHRIFLYIIIFLLGIRFVQITFLIKNPKVICYNAEYNQTDMDKILVQKIVRSARNKESPWPVNPLTIHDYLKIFFFIEDCDPQITIIPSKDLIGGYRVAIHGYKRHYWIIYIVDDSMVVQSVDLQVKT